MTSMEELIQNFMIVTEGPQVPAGEIYFEAENPKGALGLSRFEGWGSAIPPEDQGSQFLQFEHTRKIRARSHACRHNRDSRKLGLRHGGM